MSPIELLEKKLSEYERSLEKSYELYGRREIGQHTHLTHLNNLLPKIEEYKSAIYKLKK